MTPRTKARLTRARAQGYTRKLATLLYALKHSDLGFAVVEIETASGERFSKRILLPKGEPQNPLTQQETERKFDLCTARVFSQRRRAAIISGVRKFEEFEDVSAFTRLLRAQ